MSAVCDVIYYGLFAPIGSKCSIERKNKTAPGKIYCCCKLSIFYLKFFRYSLKFGENNLRWVILLIILTVWTCGVTDMPRGESGSPKKRAAATDLHERLSKDELIKRLKVSLKHFFQFRNVLLLLVCFRWHFKWIFFEKTIGCRQCLHR